MPYNIIIIITIIIIIMISTINSIIIAITVIIDLIITLSVANVSLYYFKNSASVTSSTWVSWSLWS